MDLANQVKTLRTMKGWSVAELSMRAGLSKPYIWQIESGYRKNPSGEKLVLLASALGTTVADLMGAPAGIDEQALKNLPKHLLQFVRHREKEYKIRKEDVEMLRHVHYRGKRPESWTDYDLVFLFLRRILG